MSTDSTTTRINKKLKIVSLLKNEDCASGGKIIFNMGDDNFECDISYNEINLIWSILSTYNSPTEESHDWNKLLKTKIKELDSLDGDCF